MHICIKIIFNILKLKIYNSVFLPATLHFYAVRSKLFIVYSHLL